MSNLEIFEPAMCCSTGLCGPSVDPELFRVSTIINTLEKKGINVHRFNLSQNPKEFVENKIIQELINKEGVEILPVSLLNGSIVKTKTYPSNQEFCLWLELPTDSLNSIPRIKAKKCCG